MMFYIYNKKYSHLSTAVKKLTTGDFFFGIRYCEYYTTAKGENKRTRILRKGDIKFYRKRHELMHISGIHLYPVQVFADIVTTLNL